MKKVTINTTPKQASDILDRLSASITNTGSQIEEQYQNLSTREKEIEKQKYELELLAQLAKDKENQISLYENELNKFKKSMDSDYQQSRIYYYSSNKELVEEEKKHTGGIEQLKVRKKQLNRQKKEMNEMAKQYENQLYSLTKTKENLSNDHLQMSELIDDLNDSNYINELSEQFSKEIAQTETKLVEVTKAISEHELSLIQMQLNVAQNKTEIAQLQKEEIKYRLHFLKDEQRKIIGLQTLSAKIKSSMLIEGKYRKMSNHHKMKQIKMNMILSRLNRQINNTEKTLSNHQEQIEINKTNYQKNKSEIQFIHQKKAFIESDIMVLNKRFLRKTQSKPDQLLDVKKERQNIDSKIELEKAKLEEKQKAIQNLQVKIELLKKKLDKSVECQALLQAAKEKYENSVEEKKVQRQVKVATFHEDANKLARLNEMIIDQEKLNQRLNAQFYESDAPYDYEAIAKTQVKEKYISKVHDLLAKEKKAINKIEEQISDVENTIANFKQQVRSTQKNLKHLNGINQYLEIHKTIAIKENEIDIIDRDRRLRTNIYDLETKIQQKRKSIEMRRNCLFRLSTNFYHVSDCYGLRQDTQNLIIFPTPTYSFVDAYYTKIQRILQSIYTEITFWRQNCKIPDESLLRQWLDKLDS